MVEASLEKIADRVDGARLDRIIYGLQNCHKSQGVFYPREDVVKVLSQCQAAELAMGSIKQVVDRLCDRLSAYINRPASEVLVSDDPWPKKMHAVAFLCEKVMENKLATVEEVLSHAGLFHLLTHIMEHRPVKGGMARMVKLAQTFEERLRQHGKSTGAGHPHPLEPA